jgi:antitoxin MazE
MKAQIIQIGNSQGVRIPKALLEETGISGEVQLAITNGGILIRKAKTPRSNWDELFRSIRDLENERIDTQTETEFERRSWKW